MEYKTYEEVIRALEDGKKIIMKNGGHNYCKLAKGDIGYQSEKWIRIKYYWCNPQMNRTFAMLEDGTEVDSSISILDLQYSSFIDYIEDINVTPKRMTLKQIEKELGYSVELI